MIKRTIYFSNPAYLHLKDKQLSIEIIQEAKFVTVPVEDIGLIVIDNPQITITSGLIRELQEHNVALITCDERHMPQSILLPIEGNSIQQERYDDQLSATEPLKKQLWRQIVMKKIKNQAATLNNLLLKSNYLIPLYKKVRSGDVDNCEAVAAAYYWKTIFGHVDDFVRHREGIPPNNFLNYGYSVLRATMARSIVSAGLLPSLGVFHRNRYNAFCLADDLMEPYRPYVDEIVYGMVNEFGPVSELQKEHKIILLKIPAIEVFIDGEIFSLMTATQKTAVSLTKCFKKQQKKLLYPKMI